MVKEWKSESTGKLKLRAFIVICDLYSELKSSKVVAADLLDSRNIFIKEQPEGI